MDVYLNPSLLRRYGERFEQPEVRILEDAIEVRLAQQRVLPDGTPGGLMWLVARGEREGQQIRFAVPEALRVEGAVNPAEVASLASAAERLFPTFSALCLCARATDDCDCCPSCKGRELDSHGRPCATCAGLGYVEKE